MKAIFLFLAFMTLTTSFSYARTKDETRVIILEALDNEKTRRVIDIPIQAQIQEKCIRLQINESIGITTIEITSNNGKVIYINQILGDINQYNINLSFIEPAASYNISISSEKGNFMGRFEL